MTPAPIARYLNPWALKRDRRQQRLNALRERDGDNCRRCRRPMRFDLPEGHEAAPRIEQVLPDIARPALDNFCLTHVRCNAEARDNTIEVQERVQLRQVSAAKARKRRKPARVAA
jgi:hypothetical protein